MNIEQQKKFFEMISRKDPVGAKRSSDRRRNAFSTTMFVAYLSREDIDDAHECINKSFDEDFTDTYGNLDLVLVRTPQGGVLFSNPQTSTFGPSRIPHEELHEVRALRMFQAASEISKSAFVVKFGKALDGNPIEIIESKIENARKRPTLAIAMTNWEDAGPDPDLLNLLIGMRMVQRPISGYSRFSGTEVAIHAVTASPDDVPAEMKKAVKSVGHEYAPVLPIGEFPENVIAIDLTDGRTWNMAGEMAVPNATPDDKSHGFQP